MTASRFAPLLGALLAAGCAGYGPEIRVDQDPAANFAAYRTYGFAPQLGTDRGGYGTLTSQRLREAVGRELTARGYRYVDRDPDLFANFYLKEQQKTEVDPMPGGFNSVYAYRWGWYGGWPGYVDQTYVYQYTEGTLNIDLVDRARRQLVWEGVAVGRVTDKDRVDPGPALDRAVGEIFARYPYRAAL